jgi:hypothetical protein
MRALIVALALFGTADAMTLRQVCESLCDAELHACETHRCERQVLKRCKREGPEPCIQNRACTPATTTTVPDVPTTLPEGITTTSTTATPTTTPTTLPSCVATSGTFCDRGDGTVYDSSTGLTWEKKTSEPGLHFVGTYYYHGDALSWIAQVNAENFAGHNDWRLPSESACNTCYAGTPDFNCSSCSAHELETILLPKPCASSPCIDPIFGPTFEYAYWSATARTDGPGIWFVSFLNGNVGLGGGLCEGVCQAYVRAVR